MTDTRRPLPASSRLIGLARQAYQAFLTRAVYTSSCGGFTTEVAVGADDEVYVSIENAVGESITFKARKSWGSML